MKFLSSFKIASGVPHDWNTKVMTKAITQIKTGLKEGLSSIVSCRRGISLKKQLMNESGRKNSGENLSWSLCGEFRWQQDLSMPMRTFFCLFLLKQIFRLKRVLKRSEVNMMWRHLGVSRCTTRLKQHLLHVIIPPRPYSTTRTYALC